MLVAFTATGVDPTHRRQQERPSRFSTAITLTTIDINPCPLLQLSCLTDVSVKIFLADTAALENRALIIPLVVDEIAFQGGAKSFLQRLLFPSQQMLFILPCKP